MFAMAWEWVASVSSGAIGVAGVLFGWSSSRHSEQQTEALAEQGNRHARAMAELSNEHSRQLEQLRHEQAERERRRQRLEESYLEIATSVIRLSEAMRELIDKARPGEPLDPPQYREELVRARALLSLFSVDEVRERFDAWEDQFHKLTYAVGRLVVAGEGRDASQAVENVRDLHSAWDLWRRQTQDSRLREVDARERLLAAVSGRFPAG
jgi:hypothetical protein